MGLLYGFVARRCSYIVDKNKYTLCGASWHFITAKTLYVLRKTGMFFFIPFIKEFCWTKFQEVELLESSFASVPSLCMVSLYQG